MTSQSNSDITSVFQRTGTLQSGYKAPAWFETSPAFRGLSALGQQAIQKLFSENMGRSALNRVYTTYYGATKASNYPYSYPYSGYGYLGDRGQQLGVGLDVGGGKAMYSTEAPTQLPTLQELKRMTQLGATPVLEQYFRETGMSFTDWVEQAKAAYPTQNVSRGYKVPWQI